jgi:hypothetical protein
MHGKIFGLVIVGFRGFPSGPHFSSNYETRIVKKEFDQRFKALVQFRV